MSRFRETTLRASIFGPILKDGQWLVLDTQKGVLTLLEKAEDYPAHIVKQELLTEFETYALTELLDAYPNYCPYEMMISTKTGKLLSKAQKQVEDARDQGTMGNMMALEMSYLISRCRDKLKPFGIGITSVARRGYILTPLKKRHRPQP